CSVKRQYRSGTQVLETEIEVGSGVVRLVDFMSPQTGDAEVFRLVEGVSGEVTIRSELSLRFDYGASAPWLTKTARGIRALAGPDCIYCSSDIRQELIGSSAVADFKLYAG